jgi:hypothetical protein
VTVPQPWYRDRIAPAIIALFTAIAFLQFPYRYLDGLACEHDGTGRHAHHR